MNVATRRKVGGAVWTFGLMVALVWGQLAGSGIEGRGYGLAPPVQVAALEFLAEKKAPLLQPRAVRDLAWDFSRDFEVRAAAFRCLERTTSYDVAQVRSGAFALEPRLQYLAARCLISAGETHGLALLADLAESEDKEVALVSRRLLARYTGLSPHSSIDDFRTRIDAGVECAGPLPAPSVSF